MTMTLRYAIHCTEVLASSAGPPFSFFFHIQEIKNKRAWCLKSLDNGGVVHSPPSIDF